MLPLLVVVVMGRGMEGGSDGSLQDRVRKAIPADISMLFIVQRWLRQVGIIL